ncbi:MAG: Na+/H+ antiporter NhaA [Candidatus Nanopelagicales bacterium]
MTSVPPAGTTRWSWARQIPLRRFVRTESSGSVALIAAFVAALVWANLDPDGYAHVWHTEVVVGWGDHVLAMPAVEWINSGLMAFYFFVVGLETRREFDVGELRERRRVILPVVAGVVGMAVSAVIFVVVAQSVDAAHGWGVALSTDTALALGVLALAGPRLSDRLRAFLLTVLITDDVIALVAIATVYAGDVQVVPLLVAVAVVLLVVVLKRLGVRSGLVYLGLAVVAWLGLHDAGVDPVVIGLVLGLLVLARPVSRDRLEEATDLFRDFREQPTPELARSALAGVQAALPANDRLQDRFHPWTSFVIVPLFALANGGIVLNADSLRAAATSPLTWGVILAFVVGKPVGVVAGSWLVTRLSRRRLRPAVGWAAVLGAGTVSGVGFTISLLIAAIAFEGPALEQAKIGIVAAAVVASLVTWLVFRVTALLPTRRRARALLGDVADLVDLVEPVDPERDHVRGPAHSPVTVVEYGDFQCPYCGQAEPFVRQLLADELDVRYVWRHLPLRDVHPRAQLAAEAAEAASDQGAFWEMHDLLLDRQEALKPEDLLDYARELGLDVPRFAAELRRHAHADRIEADLESADLSGVRGTPTFFVNGRRHHGAYDTAALEEAVEAARARAYADGWQPARPE